MPRRRRPLSVTGLAVPALAALVLCSIGAAGQTPALNNGVDPLAPPLYGNSANPPPFRPANNAAGTPDDQTPPAETFTPSRIGATPIYGTPPDFGAGNTGFDASNTARQKKLKRPPAPGAANAPPPETTFVPVPEQAPQAPAKPPAPPPPPPPEVHPLKAANRPGALLPPLSDQLPVSNPPPEIHPLAASTRPGANVPIPPDVDFQPSAETPPPGTPPPNMLPLGTALARPLPIAAGDPYAPLGLRSGSFLLFPSVELSGGYSSNPLRVPGGPSSSMLVAAPELQVQSDWSRHSLTADIRGTYTEYGTDLTPSLNLPYLNGTIDGRIDVRHDTQILLENRFLVSTDNPGSPNLQAGLAKLPIFTTVGGTLGLAQTFNRLQVTVKGTLDRSVYNNSLLTDGEVSSNADRDFNQYGGILRVAYEYDPGLKPFVEVDHDQRIYDQEFDSSGLQRNSVGNSAKVGADINLFGSLTGEFAAGYLERIYQDPTLPNIGGAIADGALIWQATALTTAKFTAASSVTESVLPGTSGAFSRDFSLQVDHAFLLWLIGTMQVGYGHDDYVGFDRQDNRYFASAGFTYKLNRDLQFKATLRQDWLTSNVAGAANDATSFLLGLRLQR